MSAIYPSLRGKRVFISGGGSGIGEGLVEAFVGQGAHVAFCDIAVAESEALVARLQDADVPPIFHALDLRNIEAVQAMIATVETQLGGIDILINNAANDDRHTIEEVTPAYWDERMAVNLRHLFFAAQAAVPAMKRAGGGVILNFGSISWHIPHTQLHLYMTAKAGIEGMTRALAREAGKYGVRANTVIPGAVRTPRQQALWHNPDEEARILAGQCIPERVEMQDVAALSLFLASDNARHCSGREYFVDAGWYGA